MEPSTGGEGLPGGSPGGEGPEAGALPEGAEVGPQSLRVPLPRPGGPGTPRGPGAPRGPRAEPGTGFEPPRAPGAPPQQRKVKDGFRTPEQPTSASPYLGAGEARGPVLDVESLVPGDLQGLEDSPAVAKRFASDGALLFAQVRPASLPSSERVARLWTFFAAYAEAAARHPPTPEGKAAFAQALKDQGFAQLQDPSTGQTGVEAGLWVLDAPSPEEARERAKDVQLEPPPDVRHSEQAAPMTPGLYQPMPRPFIRRDEHGQPLPPGDPDRRGGSDGKLGGRMFWNVLHRFRAGPEEEDALAEGQWDRMVFGAVLAITGVALAVIALVSSL
ncbi:Immediate early protein ICP0 [Corallococcus sp. BB11-1]|uniref:Immediate early protein ICP0 n=1 Tax=Corallococcus sp. BB11-1 TaxID=2996783 RepID=UPI00226F55F0|nr:Immediate early protein ICP0 [Corallococcus sp. BB11-1]MCY1033995.1 Immediate early protein ICP0 [Corallococcus sp. BB11-1]